VNFRKRGGRGYHWKFEPGFEVSAQQASNRLLIFQYFSGPEEGVSTMDSDFFRVLKRNRPLPKGVRLPSWVTAVFVIALGLAGPFLPDGFANPTDTPSRDRHLVASSPLEISRSDLTWSQRSAPAVFSTSIASSAGIQTQAPSTPSDQVVPPGKKAIVVAEEAFVRAGPGFGYYPTQIVRRGDVVEVFHEDPSGWVAIRPPEGSFSWVLAEDISVGEDGLGEVLRDGTPSYIGSQLGSARNHAPVKLRKGELVEILSPAPELRLSSATSSGRSSTKEEPESRWIKISPPAGEFRWIEKKAIRFIESNDLQTVRWSSEDSQPVERPTSQWKALPQPPESPPIPPGEPMPSSSPAMAGQAFSTASNDAAIANPDSGKVREWVARAQPGQRSVQAPPGERGSYQEKLDQLSLRLAQTLLKPLHQWEVESLAKECEELLTKPLPPPAREEARILATRINRALELKRRFEAQQQQTGTPQVAPEPAQEFAASSPSYAGRQSDDAPESFGASAQFAAFPGGGGGRVQPSATASSPGMHPMLVSNSGGPRFDATGRLMRVLPAQWGVPRYALVDEAGNIQAFLTPAPGLNLEYYLGRQIGVHGTCSSFGEKQTLHVMVKSVTPLDRLSRR